MRIGELAKLTGLAASRIRFYEASGLIKPAPRRANGYRDYPPGTASLLEMIDAAQRAGFSLEQIRHLLPVGDGRWDHGELLRALRAKVAEIDAMQKRLRQNKARLFAAIDGIERRPVGIACADNSKRVLDRLRSQGTASPRRKPARGA